MRRVVIGRLRLVVASDLLEAVAPPLVYAGPRVRGRRASSLKTASFVAFTRPHRDEGRGKARSNESRVACGPRLPIETHDAHCSIKKRNTDTEVGLTSRVPLDRWVFFTGPRLERWPFLIATNCYLRSIVIALRGRVARRLEKDGSKKWLFTRKLSPTGRRGEAVLVDIVDSGWWTTIEDDVTASRAISRYSPLPSIPFSR